MTGPRFTPGGSQDLMIPTDTMAEEESIELYPLGPTFMSVTAAADWASTGHSGMVETIKGVAGGRQTFADEEAGEDDPSAYERHWTGSGSGSGWGSWAEVGGAGGAAADHIPPLVEDSRDETDAVTVYPEGISIMPVGAAANWDFNAIPGTVLTSRTGDIGWQYVYWEDSTGPAFRQYTSSPIGWSEWLYPVGAGYVQTYANYAAANVTHLKSLDEDANAESASIADYADGITNMPVTSGANWGPNTGEAGHVVTERNGTNDTGRQTFSVPATGTSYTRYYDSDAWGTWS